MTEPVQHAVTEQAFRPESLRAVFALADKEELRTLGSKMAVIFPEDFTLKNVSLEGDSGLGKTTLVRAIREQLDLREEFLLRKEKYATGGFYEQGVWVNTDDEFALDRWSLRQIDCLRNKLTSNNDPELSSEHRMDTPNGVDFYEHPDHSVVQPNFDYVLKFSKAASGDIILEVHSSKEELANMGFQDFLGETQEDNLIMQDPANF